MTRERYRQWMRVWTWFRRQNRSSELDALGDLLSEMWQEDRLTSTPDQLAAYSQEFDIESDPGFQEYMRGMNNPDAVRVAQVRQLFTAGSYPRTEEGMLTFYGWLYKHRSELLPSRKHGDQYQTLKVDLSGLYKD